ncbi:MAG TPA: hypothetical protein VIV11_05680 [Kofleriaceae bacterium]
MIRTTLLLLLLLGACDPDKQIGENHLAGDAGGGDGGGGSCACGPESCDETNRVCGRSDCGFLCGVCQPGTWCFSGGACLPLADAVCEDAFGDEVAEPDRGWRVCPTNPNEHQWCECSGDATWTNCDPCIPALCSHVPELLTCGAPGCGAGEVCCIPSSDPDTRSCRTSCPPNNATRACDGPEDCGPGDACCGSDGARTASCVPSGSCPSLDQYCHSAADCPSAEPYCCPSALEDMRSCKGTSFAGCN